MLTHWNPRQVTTMEKLFDDFFQEANVAQHYQRTYSPNINVRETKDKIIVEAELAGLEKQDVKVKFESGALKISGEKKFEHVEEDVKHYAQEIRYGSFERIIPMDENYVKIDSMSAHFKNGMLTVEIDKMEEKHSKEIEIEIS